MMKGEERRGSTGGNFHAHKLTQLRSPLNTAHCNTELETSGLTRDIHCSYTRYPGREGRGETPDTLMHNPPQLTSHIFTWEKVLRTTKYKACAFMHRNS